MDEKHIDAALKKLKKAGVEEKIIDVVRAVLNGSCRMEDLWEKEAEWIVWVPRRYLFEECEKCQRTGGSCPHDFYAEGPIQGHCPDLLARCPVCGSRGGGIACGVCD